MKTKPISPRTLDAKWLDPECWDGCQSLLLKARLLQAIALVQSWRAEADRTEEHAERDAWQLGAAQAIRTCADALEAEIAANNQGLR